MTDDLDRLLDLDVETWQPTEGDKLVGTVRSISYIEGKFGNQYPLFTVELDNADRLVAVHAFHTVLSEELTAQHADVGDRVGIKFLGEITKGDKKPYAAYKVFVVRAPGHDPAARGSSEGSVPPSDEGAGSSGGAARVISTTRQHNLKAQLSALMASLDGRDERTGREIVGDAWKRAGLPRLEELTEDRLALADAVVAELHARSEEAF